MASAGRLLGPPAAGDRSSIQNAVVSSIVSRIDDLQLTGKPPTDDDAHGIHSTLYYPPPMGLTENLSPTFLSTGNPCLDFFFQVVPDTPSEYLIERLQLAWAHDALTTLKLICNLRGVRGTGKSNKKGSTPLLFGSTKPTLKPWLSMSRHLPISVISKTCPRFSIGFSKAPRSENAQSKPGKRRR
ncbi:hypothetical protein SLA2020_430690 [Shorea laevis]